jgi:EAL domain-containing protein (putative c-di-GMP-specific phosphodiesterase class I)
MKVTAEGVENAEQQLFLRAAGVHSMQGFRFGKPQPGHDIAARLEQMRFAARSLAAG